MNYSVRYTPEAMRDMDTVWDGVYEVSKSYDIADWYVEEFADTIATKKIFPFSGIPLEYRGLFTGFCSVNYKKYKAFYRVRDGYLEVIRIILTKIDYIKMLFGEQEESFDDFKVESAEEKASVLYKKVIGAFFMFCRGCLVLGFTAYI